MEDQIKFMGDRRRVEVERLCFPYSYMKNQELVWIYWHVLLATDKLGGGPVRFGAQTFQ